MAAELPDRTEAAYECCRLSWPLLPAANVTGGNEAAALAATFFLGLRLAEEGAAVFGSASCLADFSPATFLNLNKSPPPPANFLGSVAFSVVFGSTCLAAFFVITTELLVPAFWT